MKTIHLENIKSFIVISDVHLRDPGDKLTRLFIDTLKTLEHVDALILLGDIFDFIAAPQKFFLTYWKEVFDEFAEIKRRGIKIYLTEGNHDFGFEHFNRPRFAECFTLCGDFAITMNHSVHGNILLKHGDEVVCKGSYKPFRHFVKSKFLQKTATSLLAGSWMQYIFSRYAKVSRKGDQYRSLTKSFMDKKISKFLLKYYPDCDIFIMGHVHKEIDQILSLKKNVRLLVGKAWFDNPNLLFVGENKICRKSVYSY